MKTRLATIGVLTIVAIVAVAIFGAFQSRAINGPVIDEGNRGGELVVELGSEDPATRTAAAIALRGSDDPAVTEALIDNLDDPDPGAGLETAIALGQSDDPAVTEALIDEMESPVPAVRRRATIALGMTRKAIVVPALSSALTDPETAMFAAEGLARINDESAHDALLEALADEKLTTRRHAAMAAIEMADPEMRDAILSQALASDDPILVRNAEQLQAFISRN